MQKVTVFENEHSSEQWRIQDFQEGSRNSNFGVKLIGQKLNMKMNEIVPMGRGRPQRSTWIRQCIVPTNKTCM